MTVKTRAQLKTDATTFLPDNTSQEISPQDIRDRITDLADSAKLAEDLATVASSGSYADLSGKPTLGSAAALNAGTAAGNVPVLDSGGKMPASALPSYVDDVLEFANFAALPATGETGKIYVTIDTNGEYRWSGSTYTQLVASPGSTDAVPEGSTNKYFTESRVLNTVLTGLSLLTSTAIVATDSILVALGKLQKQLSDLAGIPRRETLTGNRTYFVRTDGSDTNNGLANTAGGAFLTLQKAINVALTLDLAGFSVTIQMGAGTYTGGVNLAKPFVGGQVFVVGDTTTPANVVISTTGNHCFLIDGGGVRLSVAGLKLQTTSIGQALWATNKGQISVDGKMDFGTCAGGHMLADNDGQIQVNTNYNVTGGATKHWWTEAYGLVACVGRTLTITGTPAFSSAFAYAFGGYVNCPVNTFTGSATGSRYLASLNGVINTNNAGTTYLPGNAAGSGTNPGVSPFGLYN
ncbi:hypothetical protein EN759_00295 [Mesorhizobium sp. M00.F.Ca.ET.038.03.1.1]|nr:hypothetical protein EN759_00295 [Mesorhizobium sp. M00.F.Ca.ET.038.03.1.1]TIW02372.1 MAG: hypothetical protein E5V77_06200 [Mesorhizobium sp.]